MKTVKSMISAVAIAASFAAQAQHSVTVTMPQGWYLQHGEISNTGDVGIIGASFALPQRNGAAMWQHWGDAGGAQSDWVYPQCAGQITCWYSTQTWAQDISPGNSWAWNGLDIDALGEGPIEGYIDTTGSTIAGSTFSVYWADGFEHTFSLTPQAWVNEQSFSFADCVPAVPEPESIAMFLAGLAVLVAKRRKI